MQGPPFLYDITIMLNRGSETRRLTSNSHGQAVAEVLQHLDEKQVDIYAWMVMPDHIHLLFGRDEPLDDVDTFAGRVKRRINKAFERHEWHKLRWLDGCKSYPVTLETLARARAYILANPVRGLLVEKPEEWTYAGTPSPLPQGAETKEPPR
ncbi:MAG: transposase [Planctomycetota bacterium]|nr:transposase [Planctomycetota bacterium]